MKEHTYNKTGTRQLINSGWKEFDRQTNLLTTGNAYCNTQYSGFIRPYRKTSCNGFEFEQGHLLASDKKPFNKFGIPERIETILNDQNRENSVILYMFFVRNQYKQVEPFCWLVTDSNHDEICHVIVQRYKSSLTKRIQAANEAIKYVTN